MVIFLMSLALWVGMLRIEAICCLNKVEIALNNETDLEIKKMRE